MNLKTYLQLSESQLERFDDIYRRYKLMYENPDRCCPMFIINAPAENLPCWEDRLADPFVMLKAELDSLRPHLEIGDDRVPTVRVQFGTVQVAAAFGCKIAIPTNSLPAASTHVLEKAEDVYTLEKPGLDAGWYGRLAEWTALWLENLPEGVHIQHPDIQSAFNSAHLIRGNDILMDFYDQPEAVKKLLDLVTDFMIDVTRYVKDMIRGEHDWFFDWGALWKGSARISNCSMHMINPRFYRDYILPCDVRFLGAVGGGRIHYCGTSDVVMDEFFRIPYLSGLDYDAEHHDLWSLSERAPKQVTLLHGAKSSGKSIQRLLGGDWPEKRNIIVHVSVPSLQEGRRILKQLRESYPDKKMKEVN